MVINNIVIWRDVFAIRPVVVFGVIELERISSRKNTIIQHVRLLARDIEYRNANGEYVCDGWKLFEEARSHGCQIRTIIWKEEGDPSILDVENQYVVPGDLFDYASPMKNSPGPLFTVRMVKQDMTPVNQAIILENVQDPGNVGTVIRTANAMNIPAVILCGDCADRYHPRTVRASMGALFRQRIYAVHQPSDLKDLITGKLYGAALSDESIDIRTTSLTDVSVAIGNEGNGLSEELISLCDELVIIPMNPDSESLNAASASSVIMWEMARDRL